MGINQSSLGWITYMPEHCLGVMDGFKFWRYYFPSFLETNWTFIAYILKIIQSLGEADVSFIEAHLEVRSHRINFPVLLLPQEDVWKMPAPLNWFRNEFITWGVQAVFNPNSFLYFRLWLLRASKVFPESCCLFSPLWPFVRICLYFIFWEKKCI